VKNKNNKTSHLKNGVNEFKRRVIGNLLAASEKLKTTINGSGVREFLKFGTRPSYVIATALPTALSRGGNTDGRQ
jgi:hypothetical protein